VRTYGLLFVGAATLFSAVSTWGLQAMAGRLLDLPTFANFMVVWGLFFAVLGVLQGLQQEVTRSVSYAQERGVAGGRPVIASLVIGVVGAVGLLMTSHWWAGPLLGREESLVALPLACATLFYSLFNLVGGGLAGRADWVSYARLITVEGILRFGLVSVFLLVSSDLIGLTWALACGGLSALLVAGLPRSRVALTGSGDSSTAALLRGAGHAMFASGCSALLIAGFPLLLRLTSSRPLGAEAAIVIAAVVATRAPLLITLNAYQNAVIARFVRHRDSLVREVLRLGAGILALSVPAAGLAFVVGPVLLQLLFGSAFVAEGDLFLGLVLSAGIVSLLMVTGAAAMALDMHRTFAAGWLLATVVTVACLRLPLDIDQRVVVALTLGPLSGMSFHFTLLVRRSRARQPVM
jgi:O-antigen/teichoic acid export membrane protein